MTTYIASIHILNKTETVDYQIKYNILDLKNGVVKLYYKNNLTFLFNTKMGWISSVEMASS